MNKPLPLTCLDRRRVLTLGGAATASALLPAIGEVRAQSPGAVRLGVGLPMSGRMANYGTSVMPGAELAAKIVNDSGGIKSLGGAKIQLIAADTKGDPKVAGGEIERLVVDEKIVGLLGPFQTTELFAARFVAEQYKIPFLSPTLVTESAYTAGVEYLRGLNIASSSYVVGVVKFLNFLAQQHGFKGRKVALVYDNSEYGRGIASDVNSKLKGSEFDVVADIPVTPPVVDLTPPLLRARDSGAEIIIPAFYFQETLLLLRAIDALNLNIPLVAPGSTLSEPRLRASLPAESVDRILARPIFTATTGFALDTKYEPLRRFYERASREEVGPHKAGTVDIQYYTLGAQAVFLYKLALEKAGKAEGLAVHQAMKTLRLETGAADMIVPFYSPAIEWDETGKPKNQEVLFCQWQGPKLRLLYPASAADGPPIFS